MLSVAKAAVPDTASQRDKLKRAICKFDQMWTWACHLALSHATAIRPRNNNADTDTSHCQVHDRQRTDFPLREGDPHAMASKISWFGGHMARTVRELKVCSFGVMQYEFASICTGRLLMLHERSTWADKHAIHAGPAQTCRPGPGSQRRSHPNVFQQP